jgi:hypothetical protein
VSSMCGATYWSEMDELPGFAGTAYPLNFYDLEGPVPASAWSCGQQQGFGLGTISEGDKGGYVPVLSLPPQILTLNPDWSKCLVFPLGTEDPPKALKEAPALVDVTTTQPTSGLTAIPRSSISRPTVFPTTASNQGVQPLSGTSQPGPRPAASKPSNSQEAIAEPSNSQQALGELSESPSSAAGPPPPLLPPPSTSLDRRWSVMISSAISSLRARSSSSAAPLFVLDPDRPSALQTLTTGDVVAAAQTVVAFDPHAGLLVVSGAAGVTRLQLPSLVLGAAGETTVLVVPPALLAPTPTPLPVSASVPVSVPALVASSPADAHSFATAPLTTASGVPGDGPTGDGEAQVASTRKNAGSETEIPLRWVVVLVSAVCLSLS